MTQSVPPIITQARAEAFIASALRLACWLFGRIVRFGWDGRGARLRASLSIAERIVENVLFAKAVAAFGPAPRRSRTRIPRGALPGFIRITGNRRLFYKGARIRARKANAFARIVALIEALTFPENAVRYFLKKLAKGLRLSRIVMIAPPCEPLARDARCFALDAPDTS